MPKLLIFKLLQQFIAIALVYLYPVIPIVSTLQDNFLPPRLS